MTDGYSDTFANLESVTVRSEHGRSTGEDAEEGRGGAERGVQVLRGGGGRGRVAVVGREGGAVGRGLRLAPARPRLRKGCA